jgi:3-methylcrotonyl-CoA carboxylase alpha subunit
VREGDAITQFYDPMVAKLIVHGADRGEAVRRLRAALDDYQLVGVRSNLELLRAIAANPRFAAGEVDTGFIAREADDLFGASEGSHDLVLAAATVSWISDLRASAPKAASPWDVADAWRINEDGYQDFSFWRENQQVSVRAHVLGRATARLDLASGIRLAAWAEDADGLALRLDGVLQRVTVVRQGSMFTVVIAGRNHVLHAIDPWAPPAFGEAVDDRVTAPIPARVARVLVEAGDAVLKGEPLLVLEAMKMEITLSAPMDAVVAEMRFKLDDMVDEGTVLVTFVAGGG